MRTVLIADDQRAAREGIARSVDWKGLGFSRVLLAADGREACQLILRERPDVAIVDIVMPEMTGLELVARFSGEEGAPEFVIVSGHGEFDYAQEALRHNVRDYLLKPCGREEIEASIRRVLERIEKRRSDLEERRRLKEYVESLLPQAIEQVVREFLAGGTGRSRKLFAHLFYPPSGTPSKPRSYGQPPSIQTPPGPPAGAPSTAPSEFKVLVFATGDPSDPVKLTAVKRCVERAAARNGTGDGAAGFATAVLHDAVVLILEAARADEDTLARLRAAVAGLGIPGVRLAVSEAGSLDELPRRYREAAEAVKLLRPAPGRGEPDGGQTIPWIDAGSRRYSEPVREVIRYVREHLGESTLSLHYIATNVLFLHPDYLGKRFKKECGVKFSDYLMAQRMEKAKELLLSSPGLKVYEVARMVGLGENPAYFGKVFRKYTGMLPREFREAGRPAPHPRAPR